VDHFAVARADAGADRVLALEHKGFDPRAGQRAADGEADDARADDDRFDLLHGQA
jgi:hypothetical protein